MLPERCEKNRQWPEAKIEASNIDASVYEAINRVRERIGMPAVGNGKTQEELRSIVRIERKSEFAFEGLRLYDIRRWKIAGQVLIKRKSPGAYSERPSCIRARN